MKASLDVEIHLILNKKEALWLKANMQNPLHGQNLEREGPNDNAMRERFWNALADKV